MDVFLAVFNFINAHGGGFYGGPIGPFGFGGFGAFPFFPLINPYVGVNLDFTGHSKYYPYTYYNGDYDGIVPSTATESPNSVNSYGSGGSYGK